MQPDYKTNDPRGWCGDPSRGAALGRGSLHTDGDHFEGRLYLRCIRLNQGGYDANGTYFGIGDPLYWCASDDGDIDFMLRARSRNEARRKVLERYPHAKVRR
jgi:hypothetical protein